jgi:hypothetical protein
MCTAQSFADGTNSDEFEKWKKKHNQEAANFIDQYDKDFASFLKTRWVQTDVIDGQERDNKPKPQQTPTKKPEPVVDEDPVTVVLPESEPEKIEPITVQPIKSEPIKAKRPFDYANDGESADVLVLGQTLIMPQISLPKLNVGQSSGKKLSSASISELWLVMAGSKFDIPIAALKQASQDLQLDDWGNALLTHKYLTSLKKLNQNERQLFTWFYMVKQGFDARVAFDKNEVYLMLNTAQTLYEQKFFTFDKQKYYFVDFAKTRPINIGSVYTYEQQHSSAKNKVGIDLTIAPVQGPSDKVRMLKTKVNNQAVSVKAPYNSSYIEFLDFYPQIAMEYYFQAELPDQTKITLLNQLKQKMTGLSELQATNFLLHFVQTALQYKTDQDQFHYENYLFAGETLHYPYADCEDRSVLFAYLVKHLLGNKVVGLQYDGHIATAVALKSKSDGDSFLVDGVRYTIADPTFINANVGETMTMYEGVTPKFVVF